jgi:hypothetical protein
MFMHRHALGDAADGAHAEVQSLEDGVDETAAGTKITLAFAPVSSTASSIVLNTGTPSYSWPPYPA